MALAVFNTISASKFSLNGAELFKFFNVLAVSPTSVRIINVYDSTQILYLSINVNDVEVNGVVYATSTQLVTALNPVIYAPQSADAINQSQLDANTSAIANLPNLYAPISHNHNSLYYLKAQVDALIAGLSGGGSEIASGQVVGNNLKFYDSLENELFSVNVTAFLQQANNISYNNIDKTLTLTNQFGIQLSSFALNLAFINGDATENFNVAVATNPSHAIRKDTFDSAISALQGSNILQGNWDASTNTPDISATTTTGYFWIVSVAGTTDIGGITDWVINDWAIKTSTGWAKVDNTANVLSVAGKTGVVTLLVADLTDGSNVALKDVANTFTNENNKFARVVRAQLVDKDTYGGFYITRESDGYFLGGILRNPSGGSTDELRGVYILNDNANGIFIQDRNTANPNNDGSLWHKTTFNQYELYDTRNLTKSVIDALNPNATTLDGLDSTAFSLVANQENISLGESYATNAKEYFFRNGYNVFPSSAGLTYANMLQNQNLKNASIVFIPQATKTGFLGLDKPRGEDLTVTRASTATYVDEFGVLQTAAINEPRIDFTDGKGALLVEPSATNLVSRSEQFDNASWVKTRTTITANTILAPNGTLTADKLVENTSNSNHYIRKSVASLTAGTYTLSCFLKKGERRYFTLREGVSTSARVLYDLESGTVISQAGIATNPQIVNYGNGWFRCSFNLTREVTLNLGLDVMLSETETLQESYLGDGTSGIYIWGAQLEIGSTATSYIPTVASTVTRVADTVVKTGISSLINTSEGVLYVEASDFTSSGSSKGISLSDGTINNSVQIVFSSTLNRIDFVTRSAGDVSCNIVFTVPDITILNKVAVKWRNNDFALYINGVLRGVDISGSTPTNISRLALDTGSGLENFNGKVKDLRVYTTALSDTELINLTKQ